MSGTVVYAIYEDGSVERQRVEGPDEPVLSKPGRFVTEAQYTAALGELEAQHGADLVALRDQENATIRGDYLALLASGVPEATARRLTGYSGE